MKKIFLLSGILVSVAVQAQYGFQNAFPGLATFTLPVEMTMAPDGSNRFFVVQQRGIIWVLPNDSTITTRKMFINLNSIVSPTGNETGLLGLAFHPDYSTNGYFYVNYTRTVSSQLKTFVSRFTVSPTNPDSALFSSKLDILEFDQPYTNHNGGQVLFGPDGYLYVFTGDGGSGGDPQNYAQNQDSLLGKILRINVDTTIGPQNYGIPADNPFVNDNTGKRKEIFAYGLRNPWKNSFDAVTGQLYSGDVGQNAWEEVSIIENGGNYGWRVMEGLNCYNPSTNCDQTGLILPRWVYGHSLGNSITGGFVYRGGRIPSLYGKYVFGDYGSARVWAVDSVSPSTINATVQLFQASGKTISSFAVDTANEIYFLSYSEGRIFRITGPPPVTGVGREVLGDRVIISPNPFSDTLRVRLGRPGNRPVSITLLNIKGERVFHKSTVDFTRDETFEIGTGKLPAGVYLIRVTEGGSNYSQKVVKE